MVHVSSKGQQKAARYRHWERLQRGEQLQKPLPLVLRSNTGPTTLGKTDFELVLTELLAWWKPCSSLLWQQKWFSWAVFFCFCVKAQASPSERWCSAVNYSAIMRAQAASYRSGKPWELWVPSLWHSGHLGPAVPLPFKWSGPAPIPHLSQEGSDSCWGYPGPAAKAVAMENVLIPACHPRGEGSTLYSPSRAAVMGWGKQGAEQGGMPTSPPTISLRIPPLPGQTWATKILLCGAAVEEHIAIHQAWLFRGLLPCSSPSPASCCSLWRIGCHQGRPAVSQHRMTAIAANASPEVLLLLGWVSFPFIIASIIDTACCYWSCTVRVLRREQGPWRRANQ